MQRRTTVAAGLHRGIALRCRNHHRVSPRLRRRICLLVEGRREGDDILVPIYISRNASRIRVQLHCEMILPHGHGGGTIGHENPRERKSAVIYLRSRSKRPAPADIQVEKNPTTACLRFRASTPGNFLLTPAKTASARSSPARPYSSASEIEASSNPRPDLQTNLRTHSPSPAWPSSYKTGRLATPSPPNSDSRFPCRSRSTPVAASERRKPTAPLRSRFPRHPKPGYERNSALPPSPRHLRSMTPFPGRPGNRCCRNNSPRETLRSQCRWHPTLSRSARRKNFSRRSGFSPGGWRQSAASYPEAVDSSYLPG